MTARPSNADPNEVHVTADGVPVLPASRELLDLARQRKAQAKALEALAKAGGTPEAVGRALQALEKAGDLPLDRLKAQVGAWVTHEAETRGERLSRQLRQQAAAVGLELVVVTRDPLELRLAPLGVTVDLARNKAVLQFGKNEVESCGAQAAEILQAHQRAIRSLERRPWDPMAWSRALRSAWSRSGGDGWKELGDVLPALAFELQDERFRRDPSPKTFQAYGRAELAYDLWRLRRDRQLTVDGWRLTLGPATGGSTRDKRLVHWLEDEHGRGQYFLTLRFVKEPGNE